MAEQTRFTLRINKEVLDQVKERAEDNKRSVAKEIEYILEKFLEQEKENNV